MGAGARLPVEQSDNVVCVPLRAGTWSAEVGTGARLSVERE